MSASTELQRSATALDQLFLIQRVPPTAPATEPSSGSPIQQLHLHPHLLPADEFPAFQRRSAPEALADHAVPAGIVDEFTTPTGDAHLIPSTDGSCDCPPAPTKRRPSTSAGPSCRRRLFQDELLSVPAEEVERLFGRTWTRTPPMPPASAAIPVTDSSSTAVLPAKKRIRGYAEAAA